MVSYAHHFKLLLLLCPLVFGLSQEEYQQEQLEHLHRNKRKLISICMKIQPSGCQQRTYFMGQSMDF